MDQCVPYDFVAALRSWQHEALVLKEHLPIRSPDPHVITKAQELDSILFSMNGDFSDISAFPPRNYGGIIGLQLGNHPELAPHLLERLRALLRDHPEREFYRGKLFVIEAHRIRIR